MTRRWFSKLITAAPLASKAVAENINCGALDTRQFYGPSIQSMLPQAVPPELLFPGSMEFRSTSPKSAHYKFLEKSLKLHKDSNEFGLGRRYPIIRQHDNREALNGGSSYEVNRKAFALRYNSKESKWHRDKAVKLWNLRRKTTLAEEWESAKNEIMEACSIEL